MNDSTSRPSFVPERWKDRTGAFYDFKTCWWYRDAVGKPLGVVARFDSPQGKQVIPYFKPHNGHAFKAGGPSLPVLFGLDTLQGNAAPAFVVEGEKSAAALHSLGLAAVSAQGGANKATGGAWEALASVALVYLLPDHDKPGEGYARAVCQALAALPSAPEIRVIRLPELPEKGDVVDWLQARLPGWNGFDPIPEDQRADLAVELLTIAEQGELPPADWLADDAKPESSQGKPGRLMVREKRGGTVEIVANLHNAVYLLSETPEWRGVIGYNQFRQRIEKRTPTVYGGPAGPWQDVDTAESILWLSRVHNVNLSRDTVDFAALAVANRNAFNPAQNRLRALAEQWDSIPRLAYWLEETLGAKVEENREYLAAIGAAWLKGVCARVLCPGCKRDDVLVIRSPQGWRKSTAAQAIADCIHPDSFTDSVDLGNLAEAKIQIRGVIIAELSELAGLHRGEVDAIKAFVSTKSDHFREKFGRHAQDFPRTCSFIGTTNDPVFLKDPTGNRRWWPVTLDEPIDLPRLEAALPQLLGEAARAVLAGEPWHVTGKAALTEAERVREAHYDEDVWTDEVLTIVGLMDGAESTVTIPDILDRMDIPRAQQNAGTQRRLAAILKVNGYEESRKWTEGKKRRLRLWKKISTT
ncbi:MAG TPA: VapE family protein [Candidatus Competibacter sp.]|nr:VapE family protein [Candidatus Competibacter sp.]